MIEEQIYIFLAKCEYIIVINANSTIRQFIYQIQPFPQMGGSLLFTILVIAMVKCSWCGECDMSAIVSFQDCVYYCVNKYGTNEATQRKYYNRFTGTCEKAVTCTTTTFRAFQNRCLQDFESFLIGDSRVSLPEIFQQVYPVVVHGNSNIMDESRMCYPGFFSSKRKIEIGVQVYQQYMCDIPVGSNPASYPSSHGQYFFFKLSIGMQMEAVTMDCPLQPTFDALSGLLFAFEVLFMVSALHYHARLCAKRARRLWSKNKAKGDQQCGENQ